jgi:hypothetical protein
LFFINEFSVFRIELLPYCPVGNGADVSAWDIDEIKIFGGCVPVPVKSPIISGLVRTKDERPIQGANMQLAKNPAFFDGISDLTDEMGNYGFEDLDMSNSYFIQGYKNDDVMNGVSTLDLLHIQKHLLGITPFVALDQFIAADINHSGYINVMDLVGLRKVILAIDTEFPQNTSWRIGPLPQEMNHSIISLFDEIAEIEYLESDTNTFDFIGIKVGDLNGDVQLGAQSLEVEYRKDQTFPLLITERELQPDVPCLIEFRADQSLLISGLQFALDLRGLDLLEFHEGSLPSTAENYSVIDGVLRFSWSSTEDVKILPGDILLKAMVRPLKKGKLSEMMVLSEHTLQPEVYTDNLNSLHINLVVEKNGSSSAAASIFAIVPNPANDEAQIHFYLRDQGIAEIRLMDISGRVLHTIKKTYSQGEHKEKIRLSEFCTVPGIMYCQLVSNGFTLTEKLIKLD